MTVRDRGNARQAARRRAPRDRAPRRPLTGRALVLGAVVVFLVVLLAAPLHRYLSARSSAAQAQEQARKTQQQLDQLRQLDKQQNDPAYIEQQARQRLQYAMPGETTYIVVSAGQNNSLQQAPPDSSAPTRAPGDTWNQRLWGSLQTADHGS